MDEYQNRRAELKDLSLRLFENIIDAERVEIGRRIDMLSPDPKYLDYIFYATDTQRSTIEETIDAAIEKAFQYKPIVL